MVLGASGDRDGKKTPQMDVKRLMRKQSLIENKSDCKVLIDHVLFSCAGKVFTLNKDHSTSDTALHTFTSTMHLLKDGKLAILTGPTVVEVNVKAFHISV